MENKVEELRKNMGLSQEDLAKDLGISRQTISSIERGRYNPSLELAFTISNYFKTTIEDAKQFYLIKGLNGMESQILLLEKKLPRVFMRF